MSVQKRERDVESHLVRALERIGLACVKFIPDHMTGMPDRLVLLPAGRVLWVELKTKEGRLAPIQEYRHSQLRQWGQHVVTVYGIEDADQLVDTLKQDPEAAG